MRPTESDLALQAHTPVDVVPLFGEFVRLERSGHRFLAARDGLWLESNRPWGRAVWPLAVQDAVPMPYGALNQSVELRFGEVPQWCFTRFAQHARKAHPVEIGAVVTWNECTGAFTFHLCESIEARVGHLKARWPIVGEFEHVVLDIHSHGPIAAYFSDEDKSDMGATMVVACVLGRMEQENCEIALSLFACGLELPSVVPEKLIAACSKVICDGCVAEL